MKDNTVNEYINNLEGESIEAYEKKAEELKKTIKQLKKIKKSKEKIDKLEFEKRKILKDVDKHSKKKE